MVLSDVVIRSMPRYNNMKIIYQWKRLEIHLLNYSFEINGNILGSIMRQEQNRDELRV